MQLFLPCAGGVEALHHYLATLDLGDFGSRGQQRTAVLALKLAQLIG